MARKRVASLEVAWEHLGRDIDKLSEEQGRVARNNARKAVLADLKRVRAYLDKEFPVIAAKRKPNRKPKSQDAKNREFWRKYVNNPKWAIKPSGMSHATLIETGVSYHYNDRHGAYVPVWLVAYYESSSTASVASVKRLAKDLNRRKLLEAKYRLGTPKGND